MLFHVDPKTTTLLNLREEPKPGPIIAAMPQGTRVRKLNEHQSKPVWWQVETSISNEAVTGFTHSSFLVEGEPPVLADVDLTGIPAVNLRKNGKIRSQNGGRAFPLDERGMPSRGNGTISQRAQALIDIINYLNPGKSSHRRYWPGGGKTFCNIYAYDYAMRCGVYLPRVWWKDSALVSIGQGSVPDVLYGKTVRELSANMLHDWFGEFGPQFGWRRALSVDELQTAANEGQVAIIVAKRANAARSGHIAAVVPEHGGIQAARANGQVTRPVESQAGSTNYRAKVKSRRWWQAAQFQSFGFWRQR